MRILFLCNTWAITREPARLVGVHPDLREGRHQWIRAVGGAPAAASDITYDLRRDTVRDIARRCPGGNPDVMIVWAPGYQALPVGIEEAPFPVVACYSDWPLLMPEQAEMLTAYDYIFACRAGVRIHQRMGFENVEYWPMYGHDPLLSRIIPGVEKVWDIGMVGNLGPIVQRERAPWLARVARLADRYRVRIAGGLFNEDYTRMLNATKITFNRAFRVEMNGTLSGAMNMRCYEAAACGSLLFCEEDNGEIREFFEDRVHCVLYNEQNLEELLDYYLSHDEERERITAAAAERVAEFSFPRNLRRLADRLEELDLPRRSQARRASLLPPAELRKGLARQMAGAMTTGARETAVALLQQAVDIEPQDADAHNDMAVLTAHGIGQAPGRRAAEELTALAFRHMKRAIELQPTSAFFQLNLAAMYADAGWPEAALDLARQALMLLNGAGSEPAGAFSLPFPFTWDEYRVQYSALYCATRSAPESFEPLRRCLLAHRGGMLLGRLAEAQELHDLALLGYRVAATARPDLGSSQAGLARVMVQRARGSNLGDELVEEALQRLEACLKTDPFLTDAWKLLADLLVEHHQPLRAREFIRERLTMLEALSPPAERIAMTGGLADLEEARLHFAEQLEQLDGTPTIAEMMSCATSGKE